MRHHSSIPPILVLVVCSAYVLVTGAPATASPAAAPMPNLRAARAFGPGAYTLALGDFNKDGRTDVVEPGALSSVDVLLGNGDGTFQPPLNYPTGVPVTQLAVSDFNGDRWPDLVVVGQFNHIVSVLINNGDGTFAPPADYMAGSFLEQVAAGDLNGDGKPDIVVTNGSGPDARRTRPQATTGDVVALLNNGDGTFGTATSYPMSPQPGFVTTGDFNGDGRADVAVTAFKFGGSAGVGVWLARADGTLQGPRLYAVGPYPSAITTGVLNGDDRPDLMLLDGVGNVDVMLNQGHGVFAPPVAYPISAPFPISVVATDLNHDRISDLAVAGQSGTASVLLGNGDGTFGSGVPYGAGSSPWMLASADVNNDQRSDLVVADGNTGLAVLLGKGDGTVISAPTFALPNSPFALASGDLNGDRKPDLAVLDNSDFNVAGVVSILLGDGADGFTSAGDFPAGQGAHALTTGDFNADGHLDLAIAHGPNDQDNISILLGNGDGTFGTPSTLSVPNFPSYILSGDFNHDGHADLALAISNSFTQTDDLTILLGTGDGTFGPPTTSVGGVGELTGFTAGDLNGDGNRDLILGGRDPIGLQKSTLSVFLGNADGTFGTAMLRSVAFQSAGLLVANLNGDRKPDLAVTNQVDAVAVLPGKGNGSFGPETDYPAGGSPISVAVGDLNQDGVIDLVVAGEFGTVSVLTGVSTGAFDAPISYADGSEGGGFFGSMLALGRFDSDKLVDVAVTQYNSTNVAILKQLPAGPAR